MSKLLIYDRPLMVSPRLAEKVGLNLALLLQQAHYWLESNGKSRTDGRWFYMTLDGWKGQFPFWSMSTIRRTLQDGEDRGFLISRDDLNKSTADRTKWYSLDYGQIEALALGEHNRLSTPPVQNEQVLPAHENGSGEGQSPDGIPPVQNEQATVQSEQVLPARENPDSPHLNIVPEPVVQNEQASVQNEQASAQIEQLSKEYESSDESSNKTPPSTVLRDGLRALRQAGVLALWDEWVRHVRASSVVQERQVVLWRAWVEGGYADGLNVEVASVIEAGSSYAQPFAALKSRMGKFIALAAATALREAERQAVFGLPLIAEGTRVKTPKSGRWLTVSEVCDGMVYFEETFPETVQAQVLKWEREGVPHG